eukprot:TRINITY_DN10692_c0_g7_i1.p1 TRINITY_DN10692_c0_g7~~TRINITY_DN10692_c0_g7_i1.p1  ORF type:complete len:122 (-),score=15.75 TRINITY_DN10692_c0_g7_i1:113-478(-)
MTNGSRANNKGGKGNIGEVQAGAGRGRQAGRRGVRLSTHEIRQEWPEPAALIDELVSHPDWCLGTVDEIMALLMGDSRKPNKANRYKAYREMAKILRYCERSELSELFTEAMRLRFPEPSG